MVAGHLREKNGYYYAVLNYNDAFGKRKTKWIATGLTVKGNKKKAEAFLMEERQKLQPEEPVEGDIFFADYMEQWLDVVKSSIAVATYASYAASVKRIIAPYFRERRITLKELTAKDIQDFYLFKLKSVSASSVIHYHANIHKALKYAVKLDLIPSNPADKVERPKKDHFVGSFFDADEVNKLFEVSKGTKLELPILFGAFYGLRRSEAIGLKWDAIDFENDTIIIRHTVTSVNLDNKHVLVAADTTKTKSSMRTLPLVPFVKERLLAVKAEQDNNYFRSIVQQAVSNNLANAFTEERLDVLQVDQQKLRLSVAMLPTLQPFFDEYGLKVANFVIEGIMLPQKGELGYDALQTIIQMRQKDLTKSAIQTETEIKFAEMEAKKKLDIYAQQNAAEVEIARRGVVQQKGETNVLEAQLKGQEKVAETSADVTAERLRMQLEMERKAQMASIEAEEMRMKGFNQRDVLQAEVQKAYAEGIGNMGPTISAGGGGGGSIISDMMGLGVGMAAANAVAPQIGSMMQGFGAQTIGQQAAPAPGQAAAAGSWDCPACGQKGITTNFCPTCGAKKPTPAESWDCPACGQKGITSNFCPNCGAKKPEAPKGWDCPDCGQKNITSNFCPNCGTKKPADDTWTCPDCGQAGIKTNFCPNCGKKKGE